MTKAITPRIPTFQKCIIFTESAHNQVHEIMAQKNTLSFSQVVRDAIFEYHRKLNPPYLQPSPAGAKKLEAANQEKEMASMDPKEFASKNLADIYFFIDNDNIEWVLFRKVGNFIGAVQLDRVKDWAKSEDPECTYHLVKSAEINPPYEEELKDQLIRKTLAEQYGVAITV